MGETPYVYKKTKKFTKYMMEYMDTEESVVTSELQYQYILYCITTSPFKQPDW